MSIAACLSRGRLSFNGNKLITTGVRQQPMTLIWRRELSVFRLPPSFLIPGPLTMMRWRTTGCPISMQHWEWLNWKIWRGGCKPRSFYSISTKCNFGLTNVEVAEPNGSTSNHWLVALRFTADNSQVASQQRLQLLEAGHEAALMRPVGRCSISCRCMPQHLVVIGCCRGSSAAIGESTK